MMSNTGNTDNTYQSTTVNDTDRVKTVWNGGTLRRRDDETEDEFRTRKNKERCDALDAYHQQRDVAFTLRHSEYDPMAKVARNWPPAETVVEMVNRYHMTLPVLIRCFGCGATDNLQLWDRETATYFCPTCGRH